MKQYNRIMAGKGGCYVAECVNNGFIGADFDINEDLSGKLPDKWQKFNEVYIPVYMANMPDKTKVSAGLACGMLWTVCKGLSIGSIVLTPNGKGSYYVGEITGDYFYAPGEILPHRRPVTWSGLTIDKSQMSEDLRHSICSIGTTCDITKYAQEIEALLGSAAVSPEIEQGMEVPSNQKHFIERDLHILFCTYLRQNGIYAKTIFHEKSTTKDAAQKWVHPDIVGAAFADFHKSETQQLMKATEPKKSVTLVSYELKRKIANDYDLKQYFFQALSNSNWANQGYLVAFEIDDSIQEEMKRLNEAFGIGIIRLQAKAEETEILFPAKEHELDYNTIDKLNNINEDFRNFIYKLSKVMLATKDYSAEVKDSFIKVCDEIFESDAQIEDYCKTHNIPF